MINVFKIVGVLLFTLIIAAGILFAQSTYRFDLAFNPVAAQIRAGVGGWGEMNELTPKPFKIGDERGEVVQRLHRAGFKRTPNEKVWKRYESEIEAGAELYQREANVWYCNIGLYAFLKFSADGVLEAAAGTQHEHGCL